MPQKQRDELDSAIENALAPASFIRYHDTRGFVERLESVRSRIVSLIKGVDAAKAVELLEAFIAGCYMKLAREGDSGTRRRGPLFDD